MFCLRRKRRLYDLLAGNLSATQTSKVKAHLERCANCAKDYKKLKQLLSVVAQKRPPAPSSEFWAKFAQELDEKFAQERVLPDEIKLRPQNLARISPKPALALATVLVLLIAVSFYLFGGLPTKGRLITRSDERLVNDIELIEELTDEFIVLDDQDSLLDELDLLEDLS